MMNPNTSLSTGASRSRRLRSLWLVLGIAAACATVLLWMVDQSYRMVLETHAQRQSIQTSREIIDNLTRDLVAAESTHRGFVLTDDPEYLDSYRKATERIASEARQLAQGGFGVAMPPHAMAQFSAQLAELLQEMTRTMELHQQGTLDASDLAATATSGWQRMRLFRRGGEALMERADELVAAKDAEFARRMNLSRLAFLAGVLAALCAFVLYALQRHRLREVDARQRELLRNERDLLESKVNERTQDLVQLATYLQRAIEAERASLARELHDELGALMTAAKLDVARLKSHIPAAPDDPLAQRFKHLNTTLNEAIALKRRVMESLHPSSLDNLGLVTALDILTREFGQSAGVRMKVQLAEVDLGADAELTVYRLVQEALTNIGKYAKAGTVAVSLRDDGAGVEVSVVDDGVGFDPTQLPRAVHGLAGMRHRVRAGGGELQIDSAPGKGTRISARLPYRPASGAPTADEKPSAAGGTPASA